MILTQDQKEQIAKCIEEFKGKAQEYINVKTKLEESQRNIEMRNEELSKVAKEERQIETAIDVIYRQTKKTSKIKDIESDKSNWQNAYASCLKEMNQLETQLLELMRNLPIPIDLEKAQQHGSQFSFSYFEGMEFGDDTMKAISEVVRQEDPMVFGDVIIFSDRAVVENAANRNEAIQKLVEAINTLRIRIDNLSESYEKIDELVQRLASSKLYPQILESLADKRKLSTQDISKIVNVEEREAYNSLYNLTRDNWSPSPIKKTESGHWELTLTGEILAKRLFEKYPELKMEAASKESVK